jgi:hypothetical protein
VRRAAKVDCNQPEIVQALRKAGRTVQPLHQVGKGCPDLLVGYQGVNYLLEVKTDKGDLTEDQVTWISNWRGQSWIVRSAEEAIRRTGES